MAKSYNIQVDELGIDVILSEEEINPDGDMKDQDPQEYVRAHARKCGTVSRWAEEWALLDEPRFDDIRVVVIDDGR